MNKHSTVRKQFFRYVSQNILGMIGVSAYILADTFFIAQAQGADGIAALNLVLPVYSLIFALGAMLATGAATRFALERHEGKQADGYLAEALTWAGILSVPFILLGIFSAEGIVRLLGGEPDIVTVARRIHAFSCSSRPSSCATTSCAPSSSTTAIRRLP